MPEEDKKIEVTEEFLIEKTLLVLDNALKSNDNNTALNSLHFLHHLTDRH